MNHIIEIIRQRIDDGACTVTKLADAGGVSRQHVYAVLYGKKGGKQPVPSFELLEKFANAVGIEIQVKAKRNPKKLAV